MTGLSRYGTPSIVRSSWLETSLARGRCFTLAARNVSPGAACWTHCSRFSNDSLKVDEEYLAGWFSSYPAAHLTPYVGIYSVPPSSYVLLQEKTTLIKEYWHLNPAKRIRYSIDQEYEEHFRSVLTESVRRRLRSAGPILAELSGGMDSSSILCVADRLIAAGASNADRLHTVSYFDDAETTWDERPYVTRVEEQRGCVELTLMWGATKPFRGNIEEPTLSLAALFGACYGCLH